MESVEDFRLRARAWIKDNLVYVGPVTMNMDPRPDEEELAAVAHDRQVQRRFFDAGFAGLCVPVEYGGQGLTPAHQRVWNEELAGYEFPLRLGVPTMTPCLAVLLDLGTEEQKQRHIPAILKGEQIWAQMLSEPSGGSDVAGALTTATRDGADWLLNGSKIWTTGAWWSDWALCLARTNWDVPKHRGLTVFMVPLDQPGLDVHRIEVLNGNKEFCQEFLTDVRVPDTDRLGEVDDGWTVGTRWMSHERMLYNSPYVTFPVGTIRSNSGGSPVITVARDVGRLDDPVARELIGEVRALELVDETMRRRITEGVTSGLMPDQSASMARITHANFVERKINICLELAGDLGAAWTDDDGGAVRRGVDFLTRQADSIAGGTTEMARNVVSERLLGMPREQSHDRDLPFRDVPRGGRT